MKQSHKFYLLPWQKCCCDDYTILLEFKAPFKVYLCRTRDNLRCQRVNGNNLIQEVGSYNCDFIIIRNY